MCIEVCLSFVKLRAFYRELFSLYNLFVGEFDPYIITNIYFLSTQLLVYYNCREYILWITKLLQEISTVLSLSFFWENFCRESLLFIFVFFFVKNLYYSSPSFLYRESSLFIFVFYLLENLYCLAFFYSFGTISSIM